MSGVCQNDLKVQFERAKKKYQKVYALNQIIDDDTQMSKEEKINAVVLIAKNLVNEQSKYEKEIKLREEREKQLSQEIEYKNKVIEKYQDGLLKAKNDYY